MQAEGIQNARAAYNDAVFMRADAATNTTASKNVEKKKITECSNAISRSIISNKKMLFGLKMWPFDQKLSKTERLNAKIRLVFFLPLTVLFILKLISVVKYFPDQYKLISSGFISLRFTMMILTCVLPSLIYYIYLKNDVYSCLENAKQKLQELEMNLSNAETDVKTSLVRSEMEGIEHDSLGNPIARLARREPSRSDFPFQTHPGIDVVVDHTQRD